MKNICIIALLFFSLSSCSSFLEEYSQDLSRVETVSDLDELLLGGVYHNSGYIYIANFMYHTEGSEGLNLFINFMSDELQQNTETGYGDLYSESVFGYYTWQRDVGITLQGNSVGTEDTDWNLMYQYINAANMIIDELPEVEATNEDDAADKIRIEGEAHFLRALYYFTLVNLYAEPYAPSTAATTPGIPLKNTSYIEDKEYTRNTVAEVYKQILSDLDRAEECLSQTERKSLYRADITATYLLKSRVYLYMQDWENARTYAQNVLDRNSSLTNLNSFNGEDNVFTSSSPEAIFSMGGHFLSYYIYGYDDYEDETPFFISDDLVEAFDEENDLRKGIYITETPYGWLYKKIYWASEHYGVACSVSDNYFFRTSEAYLNLAEAAAMDNDEATAIQMLTELRARRFTSAPAISASGTALIDLIRKERQRELCLEGHRWYDLRRYTVCEEYPWSKSFQHTFTEFNYSINYSETSRVRVYELEEYDKAYTLAFPREVRDFQNTLATNERPERQPIYTSENQ